MEELENKIAFTKESGATQEQADAIYAAVQDGTIGYTNAGKHIADRLNYLISHKSETNDVDLYLLEIAARYMSDDGEVFASAINLAYEINAPFTFKYIKKLLIEPDDWEDYMSEMKLAVLTHLKEYDHTKGKLTTFYRNIIMGAIYEKRNPGTRYNASITKKAITAKNELEAQGIKNPDESAIARHINVTNPFYSDVSDTQVRNALNARHSITDIDEQINLSDDTFNPEKAYIKKEEDARLRAACDNEQWAVKALYEIYCEYYLADAPVNIKSNEDDSVDKKLKWHTKLPVDYLRRELFKKTGVDFSKDKIESIQRSIQDALRHKGVDRGVHKKKDGFVVRTQVETYSPDLQLLTSIEEDILSIGWPDENENEAANILL